AGIINKSGKESYRMRTQLKLTKSMCPVSTMLCDQPRYEKMSPGAQNGAFTSTAPTANIAKADNAITVTAHLFRSIVHLCHLLKQRMEFLGLGFSAVHREPFKISRHADFSLRFPCGIEI